MEIVTLSDEKRASDLQIDISVPLLLPPSYSKKNNKKNFVENAGKYRKCFQVAENGLDAFENWQNGAECSKYSGILQGDIFLMLVPLTSAAKIWPFHFRRWNKKPHIH